MDNMTLARPYANAVYALAEAHHHVDAWAHALTVLAQTAQTSAVRQFVNDPRHEDAKITQFFIDILHAVLGAGLKAIESSIAALLTLMQRQGRLLLLPALLQFYRELLAKKAGVQTAEVASTLALTEENKAALQVALEKQFQTKLHIAYHIDETLLGGILVRCGSDVIDGSVKGRLDRLKAALG